MAEALRHLLLIKIVGSHSYRPVTITGLSQMDGDLERELEEWLASLKLCALFFSCGNEGDMLACMQHLEVMTVVLMWVSIIGLLWLSSRW